MQLEFISNNGHARITLDRVRQQVRRKVSVQYRHSPRYARMPYVVMLVLTRETLSAGDGENCSWHTFYESAGCVVALLNAHRLSVLIGGATIFVEFWMIEGAAEWKFGSDL